MSAVAETGVAPMAGARPRARWWVVLVGLVVGALVAASGTVLLVRDDRRLAAAGERSAARATVAAAVASLAAPVSAARAVLADSAGRVDDERVRSNLTSALDEALAAARGDDLVDAGVTATTGRTSSARAALVAATAAVSEAVARHELTSARAAWVRATSGVDEAIAAASGVFDASAGRVADDAIRQSLATAIDSAQAVRRVSEPADVAGLVEATRLLTEAADSLVAPRAAVATAADSWEQAQIAAAAAKVPGTAAPKKAPSSTAPSAGTKAPGGSIDPYDGLTWVPDVEGVYTWCMDGSGATWWCNATPVPGERSDGRHWEETVTNDDSYAVCMDTEGNWWWCDS